MSELQIQTPPVVHKTCQLTCQLDAGDCEKSLEVLLSNNDTGVPHDAPRVGVGIGVLVVSVLSSAGEGVVVIIVFILIIVTLGV